MDVWLIASWLTWHSVALDKKIHEKTKFNFKLPIKQHHHKLKRHWGDPVLYVTASCVRYNLFVLTFLSGSNNKDCILQKTMYSADIFTLNIICGLQLLTKKVLVYTVLSYVVFIPFQWLSWRMFPCEWPWGLKLQNYSCHWKNSQLAAV